MVDDSDYDLVKDTLWSTCRCGYANTRVTIGKRRQICIKMHRVILDVEPGVQVDHVNGNGLDNRRSNLRLADNCQNGWNRKRDVRNKSGVKGVYWHSKNRRWIASIKMRGLVVYRRSFGSLSVAENEIRKARVKFHGEFARHE